MKRILYFISFTVLSVVAVAQVPFSEELQPSFNNATIKLDCKLFGDSYNSTTDFLDVLAISSDCTVYDYVSQKFAPMKGSISGLYMFQGIGNSTDSVATVYATFDKNEKNNDLGDGGGIISFKIQRNVSTGAWGVVSTDFANEKDVYFTNVNFRNVGGTVNNQDIAIRGVIDEDNHRILVTEDAVNIRSNKDLAGFSDTTDYTYPVAITQAGIGISSVIPADRKVKKYQEMGWAVEINGITGNVMGKIHRMGRGVTSIASDGSDIYFVYGGNPSVLMKFSPGDLNKITNLDKASLDDKTGGEDRIFLTAYKQNADGTGGFTVPVATKVDTVSFMENGQTFRIPKYSQIFDSLLIAKEVALRAGATPFGNIGDIAIVISGQEGQPGIVFTEKGIDDSQDFYSKYQDRLPLHLKALDAKDGTVDGHFNDYFGRVLYVPLNVDFMEPKIKLVTEGGASKGDYFFSNPDKLEIYGITPRDFSGIRSVLVVKENIPSTTMGRNPSGTSFDKRTNEAYYLERVIEDGITQSPSLFETDNSSGISVVDTHFPFDATDPNRPTYKLFQTAPNGTTLPSSVGNIRPRVGTLISNDKGQNEMDYDTYLTVIKDDLGKSLIVAVRNIYPNPAHACQALGLEEAEEDRNKKAFTAWPNPSSGLLNVSDIANYTVIDARGNEVKSFVKTTTLDISDLDKGLYFLKRDNGVVRKIVLQ